MDGKTVGAENYKASASKKNGKIAQSKKYMAKLKYGKHTLVMTTEKGDNTVTFWVKKAAIVTVKVK